ncbi:type II CRISPR RNA-guided endonuclease Cas9 [Paratractidigestivibacter sp.]|uniref:type II CRISPR RNA-guided endonuclease Cas9 n=1 Tax=Paratractidigestivibacter sp. TaxID=2847316 RepID=UPI002AC8A061|nr:type II CRISPR RNA-guided endonuclease Cas9 [Paratractidigestivibacter sp.]
MNLRNFSDDFSVGLDLGTGSVGWAVTDEDGKLLHFKKQPTWGSRLFDSAETAATARTHRGQRRRYIRRRWRLNFLQGFFEDEVKEVDPEFFFRLRQSRLLKEDRGEVFDYCWPHFNDSDFTEKDYYEKFPTIYHLRAWLMETDEKADVRLIYLAAHNIVKHRGNFLRQDQKSLSAKTAKPDDALKDFFIALKEWCDAHEASMQKVSDNDISKIVEAFEAEESPLKKREEIVKLIKVELEDDASGSKRFNAALSGAMVGLKTEFRNVFGELAAEKTSIYLSNDEDVETLHEVLPDDGVELFDKLCAVYSAYLLQGLLSYAPGQTISYGMIAKYKKYGDDLDVLQQLVKDYLPKEKYKEFFRGDTYPGTDEYDVSKAKGYTLYNLSHSKMSYENFAAYVKKELGSTAATEDERYIKMMAEFEQQRFLRRLKTSDNGSIFYQLHFEELDAILESQGRFYPFLLEEKDKIESLVSFRIPYYVGPLSTKHAAVDARGKRRFAWSERKPGMEDARITPWNWEEIIDKDASAEKFIKRMTGNCTYLQGEDVLPKCSLLYEEFCVLNELNGLKICEDGGDHEHRLDAAQREGIIHDLFYRKASVSYKDIQNWLKEEGTMVTPQVRGGQGANGLESSLASYRFFAKKIFDVRELDECDILMVEEIIHWNTLFEDRRILKQRIEKKYGEAVGGPLNASQIKKICNKRFSGWGKLSERFLTGLKVDTEAGKKSIMDVLREGDPNSSSRKGRALVLMEALRDEDLGFQKRVDDFNAAYFRENAGALGVNELPGSPANRRGINQAIRIVDEISKIAGHAPKNIFVEVTRDEDSKSKGKRTKRRYDELKNALEAFKKDDPEIWKEICAASPKDMDERLTLYFMQRGKCLYSKRRIDINQLSDSGLYEVDHIIPRAYVKDDSLENKALVYREENQRKTDELLIDPSIRIKMSSYWRELHEAKLIGDKKFNNLLRSHIDEKTMKGFVARQLVETSQMVKLIQSLLRARYPEANIVPVKANLSHNLREREGLVKCREANDFHHAHDAYLACRIGLFIQRFYPNAYDNPIALSHVIKKYVREESEEFKKTHTMPGSAGYFINRFVGRTIVDRETGEIFWDPESEVESIRKVLNCRQCYITRMPFERAGAFWNANPVSPKGPAKSLIELKRGLNSNAYGGFTSKNYAYFFVYEEADAKGKTTLKLAGMPIYLKDKGESALEFYANKLAADAGRKLLQIVVPHLYCYQLIEIDGKRYFLSAEEEMKNAVQLSFSLDEAAQIKEFVDGNADRADNAMGSICRAAMRAKKSPLASSIDFGQVQDAFKALSDDDKKRLVDGILLLFRGGPKAVPVNMACAGGPKSAGRLRPARNKVPNNFAVIDQSVTGMFEKRIRIGL